MAKAVPHIVYIHGLNCSGKTFSHLISQLPQHTATIAEYDSAQAIDNSIESVLYSIPALKPIVIIGHSLGGIIGHLLCTRSICNLNIKKLVSVSTPFGGSEVAGLMRWLYPGYSVLKDLSPSSGIIKEIAATPVKLPFLSLVSVGGNLPFIPGRNDGIVTIKSQMSVLAQKRVEIHANHFEALQDPKTIKEIRDFVF